MDVFQAVETVAKAHRVTAFLTYEAPAHEEVEAVAGFVAKSKELGCDAVQLLRTESVHSNNDRRLFRANAIIYSPAK
jgi:hypothetical protein